MFPAFAYSVWLQVVLAFVLNAVNFLNTYLATDLMLSVYGEHASHSQKLRFSFWVAFSFGALVYGVFFFDNSFTRAVRILVTVPNPLLSALSLYLAVRTLKLSKYHAIHIHMEFYLYMLMVRATTLTVGEVFFPQPPGPYNYLVDLISVLSAAALNLLIHAGIRAMIHRFRFAIRLSDHVFAGPMSRNVLVSFCLSAAAYAMVVCVPLLLPGDPLAYLLIDVILGLSMLVSALLTTKRADMLDLHNKDQHIQSLMRANDEFSGVKHDFYNILSTYSGYLHVGDLDRLRAYHDKLLSTTTHAGDQLDLTKRMEENPALISLLLQKLEYAEQSGVHMRTTILTGVRELHIDPFSLCRALACLLDNAVEAAEVAEEKRVVFSIERKPGGNLLIAIVNSTFRDVDTAAILTPGYTDKPGHSGLGIIQARGALAPHRNCSLQLRYYNGQFIVYIEIQRA